MATIVSFTWDILYFEDESTSPISVEFTWLPSHCHIRRVSTVATPESMVPTIRTLSSVVIVEEKVLRDDSTAIC